MQKNVCGSEKKMFTLFWLGHSMKDHLLLVCWKLKKRKIKVLKKVFQLTPPLVYIKVGPKY